MASKTVEDSVDAYLAANWPYMADCPIFVENEQGEIPFDGSAFLKLQYPVANVDRFLVEDRGYREEGGFRVLIHVQRGAGTDTIRQYGSELARLFRDQTFNGVECLVPSEPFTDDANDEGLYFVGSVVVPYRFYFRD